MAENTIRLRELIDEFRWKQRPPLTVVDFAKLVGVSPAAVHSWRNGTSQPEVSRLWTIALKTGVAIEDLMSAAGYPVPPNPDEVFAYIVNELRRMPVDPANPDEKERTIHHIEELRERYHANRATLLSRENDEPSNYPKAMAGV